MWTPSKLEIVRVTFSFEASAQGGHRDHALRADDETLVNMLDLVEWGDDPVQVAICEDCGIVGCATGGHVALRRLGAYVLLAPSTRAYVDAANEADRTNFSELPLIRKRGLPLIPTTEWERVRAGGARLPSVDRMRALTWREAVLAAQFEAPLRLLGNPDSGIPRLSELVTSTDPRIAAADLDKLGEALGSGIAADAEASVRPSSPATLYSFVLSDSPRNVVLFGSIEGSFGLYFEPGLLVLPAASTEPFAPPPPQ